MSQQSAGLVILSEHPKSLMRIDTFGKPRWSWNEHNDRYIINNGTHKKPVQVDSLYHDEKFFHNKITKWSILICITYNPVTHNNNKKCNWEMEILLPVSLYITEDLGGADFPKRGFLWLTMLMCPRTSLAGGGDGRLKFRVWGCLVQECALTTRGYSFLLWTVGKFLEPQTNPKPTPY